MSPSAIHTLFPGNEESLLRWLYKLLPGTDEVLVTEYLARMKPLSMSVWIFPAAWRRLRYLADGPGPQLRAHGGVEGDEIEKRVPLADELLKPGLLQSEIFPENPCALRGRAWRSPFRVSADRHDAGSLFCRHLAIPSRCRAHLLEDLLAHIGHVEDLLWTSAGEPHRGSDAVLILVRPVSRRDSLDTRLL